jgi:hypothetical protein
MHNCEICASHGSVRNIVVLPEVEPCSSTERYQFFGGHLALMSETYVPIYHTSRRQTSETAVSMLVFP